MDKLIDRFGRRIDYLRISVTDRCNLRCVYCMPDCGIHLKPHDDLLSFEEIVKIVTAAARSGIDKIRLTGGEPLVRKDIIGLVGALSGIEGIKDLSMTTNGILLKEYAIRLKRAGLNRLNVSLDTLKEDRYRAITRQGLLEDVLEGIERSAEAGISPVKINVLLLDDIDQNEIANFLRLTIENRTCVRFLEFMQVNSYYRIKNRVSCRDVMDIARRFGEVEDAGLSGNGPARAYRLKNGLGSFGLISPMSDKFCATCNRLRLTSDGFLKPCLHSDIEIDLRAPLRRGADISEIARLIRLAVEAKPEEHHLEKEVHGLRDFSMCQIGG